MKISLVILTLNEIVGLREIFPKIPQHAVDEIFVVDGGSTDGTLEYFESHNIRVFKQERRGRGDAFRVAFEKASGDAIIFFSPDGNEDPADIPKFKPLLESGADIVIGDRMSKDGHNEEDHQVIKIRKWANNFLTLIANLAWNRNKYIRDTINGYRAIQKNAWNILAPDGPGYTIEYQTTIRAMKHGMKVLEFPTYESARIDSQHGSPGIATGIAMLKIFMKELRANSKN